MRTEQGILRDIMRLFIWYPFRWLTKVIPVGATLFLLKTMGDLHYAAGRNRKRIVLRNMQDLLGGSTDRRVQARKYFENHYIDRLHIFLYSRQDLAKTMLKRITFRNLKTIDRLLDEGRGVLVVQPHFGPVQITLLALALRGYAPIQIGYPNDRGLSRIGRSVAFSYRLKYEAMLPAPIIPADRYMGGVFKHLKKPGIVLTTGDGAGGDAAFGEQREFQFFGKKRVFPVGPAAWAMRTGAAFVPTFIIPESYGRFRVVFEKPIEPVGTDADERMTIMTAAFISVLERYARENPECWHFWDEI